MRLATINVSELGNDWRAEAHVEPSDDDYYHAKRTGWTCGAKGSKYTVCRWRNHGNLAVRAAFWRAYEDGLKARRAYLNEKGKPNEL